MNRRLRREVRSALASYTAWRGALFLVCALAMTGPGQAADGKLHLLLSTEPIEGPRKTEQRPDVWHLRPNVQQEVFTSIQNDDPSQAATVLVQLRSGGVEVAKSPPIKVEKAIVPVQWIRPPGAAAGSSPVLAELKRPVELRLLDADGKIEHQTIRLDVFRPSEYLEAPVVKFFPAAEGRKNRLLAVVKPKKDFRGPPCRVELVLDPARIPGFDPGKRGSVYPGYVWRPAENSDEDGAAYVVAEDVRLRDDTRKGLITIRADGYDHAFLFDTTFARSTGSASQEAQKISDTVLRINAPPMVDSRKPVHVSLEADNVGEGDKKRLVLDLVTRVDHGDNEGIKVHFRRLAEFAGDRSKRIFAAPGGPNNGLLFKPEVKYWSTDLLLDGLRGKIELRLRLLSDKKNEPFLDTETDKWDKVNEVRKRIVLDDTPPEVVRIDPIAKAVRGRPFLVRARGSDDESDIHEVVFFVGRPQADGKVPPQAIPVKGRPVRNQGDAWQAELMVPLDQRGPLEVSARFTNGVGLSTTKVAVLQEVAEPPPPPAAAGAGRGSIAGIVTEGDRPQRGLPVDLTDAAGKVLVSTRTDANGAFIFRDLAPGAYRVASIKTASNTRGTTRNPITLAAGENKTGIRIKLYRQ